MKEIGSSMVVTDIEMLVCSSSAHSRSGKVEVPLRRHGRWQQGGMGGHKVTWAARGMAASIQRPNRLLGLPLLQSCKANATLKQSKKHRPDPNISKLTAPI